MKKPATKATSMASAKTASKAKPATIAAYISAAPKEAQARMHEIAEIFRKAAPKAEESIKWAMPSFSYKRILFMFGAFKHHIGLYPTPAAISAFKKEVDALKLKSARGSIQLPFDKPLPKTLIAKIAKFRVKESIQEDGKWKPQKAAK